MAKYWFFVPLLCHIWLDIRKSIGSVKNWVMRCWCGYQSEVRCKWFAHGPADATATPSSLTSLKSRWVYTGCPEKEAIKWVSVCIDIVLYRRGCVVWLDYNAVIDIVLYRRGCVVWLDYNAVIDIVLYRRGCVVWLDYNAVRRVHWQGSVWVDAVNVSQHTPVPSCRGWAHNAVSRRRHLQGCGCSRPRKLTVPT